MGKRILLTGMSGTGKSTLLRQLASDQIATVDLDEPGWMETDSTGERLIRIDRVRSFLAENAHRHVVLAGCAINQRELYGDLDAVILLTAPLPVMRRRIQARTDNPFGKSIPEWQKSESDTKEVVPLLRRSCTLELNTDRPLSETVEAILFFITRLFIREGFQDAANVSDNSTENGTENLPESAAAFLNKYKQTKRMNDI